MQDLLFLPFAISIVSAVAVLFVYYSCSGRISTIAELYDRRILKMSGDIAALFQSAIDQIQCAKTEIAEDTQKRIDDSRKDNSEDFRLLGLEINKVRAFAERGDQAASESLELLDKKLDMLEREIRELKTTAVDTKKQEIVSQMEDMLDYDPYAILKKE